MEPCDIRPPRAEAISVGQRSLPLALLVGCASTPVLAELWHCMGDQKSQKTRQSEGTFWHVQRSNSKALAPKACEGVAEAAACLKKWLGVMGEAEKPALFHSRSVPHTATMQSSIANQPESEAGERVLLRLGICS